MTVFGADTDAWIRRFHPAPDARTQLVFLPHAGGSASFFFSMSKALASSVDVLCVQYPGRQDRHGEPCIESIPELADQVAHALRPWSDRPIILFGHSMGATLSFEVALRMEQAGNAPAQLFVSGRRAPSRTRDEQRVHLLDDNGLIAEIRALSGTDSQALGDEELLRLVLPAIRSDYKAVETYAYRPGTRLACPITALVGDNDPKVTIDEAQAWQEHTNATFALRVFDGGHFYLSHHQQPIVDEVRAALNPVVG